MKLTIDLPDEQMDELVLFCEKRRTLLDLGMGVMTPGDHVLDTVVLAYLKQKADLLPKEKKP